MIRTCQRGFSLAELMITIGIGSVVALGTSSLMSFAAEQFFIIMEKSIAEESLLTASYLFRSYLSQAVDVRGVTRAQMNAAATGSCAQGIGCPGQLGFAVLDVPGTNESNRGNGRVVLSYDTALDDTGTLRAAGAFNGTVDRLAAFYRETASPIGESNPAASGSFRGTAIWFELPNVVAGPPVESRFGRLIFDSSPGATTQALSATAWSVTPATADVTGAGVVLSPDRTDTIIDRIVRVRMTSVNGSSSVVAYESRVRSVTVVITARYFRGLNRQLWRWCPDRSNDTDPPLTGQGVMVAFDGFPIDQCERSQSDPYKDLEQTVVVTLRNNILSTQSSSGANLPERAFGFLYFYQPLLPLVNF